MVETWITGWLAATHTTSQILTAGVAITAFSLLLYSLTFNLRDRVTRSFALITCFLVIVFTAESIGSTTTEPVELELWLRLQWVGIIFLPSAYLHFSDALLSTTGRPSRWRRLWAIRLTYIFSFFIFLLLPTQLLIGRVAIDQNPVPHLMRTGLTDLFAVFYGFIMILAWINFYRAYKRTLTRASRRRMIYLMAGATAPALGAFPILFFGTELFSNHALIYWSLALLNSLVTGVLLVLMAYAVAFFGVTWPDRVVKSRLFVWLLRGPVTASVVLGVTTIVRRAGALVGTPYSALVPIAMVTCILLFEFMISLFSPIWERWFFYGRDRADLSLLQTLEERLLTSNDLKQFLEVVVAAVCDKLQSPNSFVAAINEDGLELIVTAGDDSILKEPQTSLALLHLVIQNHFHQKIFQWGQFSLLPLVNGVNEGKAELLGLLGFTWDVDKVMDDEQAQSLTLLSERVIIALRDRKLQRQVFSSLKTLNPQVSLIQQLTAASRYDREGVLMDEENLQPEDFTILVKEALTHYWGGPKLTQSPLMRLQIVREAVASNDGNNANALRAILRKAIDQVKPEGERRFTGEWILYNILEMKFLEGKKVREIALRLAMSEADLYRKQRVAIEAVTKALIDMESKLARK
jgi:hypothetical protein